MLKEVKDFIPVLHEKFPYLSKKDIKLIVEYGWRMLYMYTLKGCDVLATNTSEDYWIYFGLLRLDSVKHYRYYIRKLRKKIRILYHKKYKKRDWDGYYYFGLTEEEYKDFLESKNKKGRKRVNYSFNHKVSFLISDEAKLDYNWSRCIIRYKYPLYMGDSFYKEIVKCTNPEIVLERDTPCTFKDILVSSNNYDNI